MIGLSLATAWLLWCPNPMVLNLSRTPWTTEDQVVVNESHEYCSDKRISPKVRWENAELEGEWPCAMMVVKKDIKEYRGLYTIICSSFLGNKDQIRGKK